MLREDLNLEKYLKGNKNAYVDPKLAFEIVCDQMDIPMQTMLKDYGISLYGKGILDFINSRNVMPEEELYQMMDIKEDDQLTFEDCFEKRSFNKKYHETYKYFYNYVEILQEKSLKLLDLLINCCVYQGSEDSLFDQSIEEYDLNITKDGRIFLEDLIRLILPLIENLKELDNKVNLANNPNTYEEFMIDYHNLYKDGFTEDDLYPSRKLQIKNILFDTEGYIRLSGNQKREILNGLNEWFNLSFDDIINEPDQFKMI